MKTYHTLLFLCVENFSDSEVMSSSVSLHHSVVRCERGRVCLVEEEGPGPVTQEEGVFRRAAAVLMCASYRNQAVHVFTRPAMVAVAMITAARNRTGESYYRKSTGAFALKRC